MSPTLQRIGSDGFPIHLVRSGSLELAFAPSVGGRLISLRSAGVEFLWRNPGYLDDELGLRVPPSSWPAETNQSDWLNLGGSKTWPAPQDRWMGPPDPVLDRGAYSFYSSLDNDDLIITMTSEDDPRTGLRISRTFTIPDNATRFRQLTTFTCIGNQSIDWSIWEVCQVNTSAAPDGAAVQVDLGHRGRIIDLGRYWGEPHIERYPEKAVIPVQPVVAKWGFTGPVTMISYGQGDQRLQLCFSSDDDAEYPDGGSVAELWMQSPLDHPIAALDNWQPNASLLELEVLSPLHRLSPGQSASLAIQWAVSG